MLKPVLGNGVPTDKTAFTEKSYEEGILCIAPDEETVVGIHLNLSGDVEVEVVLPGNRIRKSCPAGMRWIGNIPSLIK